LTRHYLVACFYDTSLNYSFPPLFFPLFFFLIPVHLLFIFVVPPFSRSRKSSLFSPTQVRSFLSFLSSFLFFVVLLLLLFYYIYYMCLGDTLYVNHVKPSQGDESRNILQSSSGSHKALYFYYSKF
jgi:hypothetical protein